jgi:NNP family nitrate/nitrite transporter-like MFS transporter
VIGIRLVSEWFPAREVGIAEGIYGGWGNFGAAVASMSLPALALSLRRRRRLALCHRPAPASLPSSTAFLFYRGVTRHPGRLDLFQAAKSGRAGSHQQG